MQSNTDSESGVTVSEEPYIEEEREASSVVSAQPLALPPVIDITRESLRITCVIAPLVAKTSPRVKSAHHPVILGNPATFLVGNAEYH